MSDVGNAFKDRLKMFEQNKLLIGQKASNDNSPDFPKPAGKLGTATSKTTTYSNDDATTQNLESYDNDSIKPPPKPCRAFMNTTSVSGKISSPNHPPPLRAPPPNIAPSIKSPPTVARLPPKTQELSETKGKLAYPKNEAVSVTEPSKQSRLEQPPPNEESQPQVRSQAKVVPRAKAPPLKSLPPEAILQIDLTSNNNEIPTTIITTKVPITKSPHTNHPPPPPPPPPLSKLGDKIKSGCDATELDSPPPVPPPPPSIGRSKGNTVVGWAPQTQAKKADNVSINPQKAERGAEVSKPPPILVAPPSLESFTMVNTEKSSKTSKSSGENPDDTYDDDNSCFPWYFEVTKSEATMLMRDYNNVGTFMVRPSDHDQYVLMVRSESEVIKKFKIQPHMNGWILGDINNAKKVHSSMSNLIDFYCENGIKVGKSSLKLKEPVPKEQ